MGAEHKLTVAYSHEENGINERSNHETRYLRAMVFDKNSIEDWSEVLPFSQRICNAEIVSSIGVAPAEIIFGAAIRLDRGILVPNTERLKHLEASHGSMSSYVSKLIATQQRGSNRVCTRNAIRERHKAYDWS